MRFKHILYTGACFGLLVAPTIAAEEGFVFTEEDVAAAEEEAQKLQSVIANEETYRKACFAVYSDVNLIVGNCFRAIGREVDYTECADARTFASIHKEAVEKLVTKYGADAASGQLTKGALSRAALNMAKPNITPGAYNAMEKQLERTAVMLRWFMGSFAGTCARYDSGFYKEVQQVARFKELTQSGEYKRMESEYPALWNYFDEGRALRRFHDGKQDLYTNTYQAYVDRTLPSLFKMSEVLWGLEDYLKAETRYFHNLEKKEEYSICQWADTIVKSIKPRVMDMREQAARVVPQSHPSRSRN